LLGCKRPGATRGGRAWRTTGCAAGWRKPGSPPRPSPRRRARISPKGAATFGARCNDCPLRTRCTTAKTGRSLHVTDHDDQLVAARAQAATPEFADAYPARSLVERSIAWLVKDGHRRCRYRGVKRNQLGLSLRVAAVNLARLLNLGLRHDGGWTIPTAA